jgi:hypothetical protein
VTSLKTFGLAIALWYVAASASTLPQPTNGAVTPELSSTGIPLDAVVANLDASGVAALCGALGKWNFRIHPQMCLAFVQSAIILQPRSEAEDRVLCSENLRICGPPPQEPTPACASLPNSCKVTLGEIDRCIVQRERALLAIPTCENMTRALAPSTPGAPFDQPSCTKITTVCSPAF